MRCQPHQPGEEVIAHPGKPTGFRRTGESAGTSHKNFYCESCFHSIMTLI
jgi:hypothetical protein